MTRKKWSFGNVTFDEAGIMNAIIPLRKFSTQRHVYSREGW
jgi:hypothetical protein